MNKVGEVYFSGPMAVYDQNGVPITTLVDADFTKELFLNGNLTAKSITVKHLSNGNYQAEFLPDVAGAWTLIITQATYAPNGWAEEAYIETYSFRPIPIDEVVTGSPNAILDSIMPGDFRDYFTKDFRYLPAYNNDLVYFIGGTVSLTIAGTTNFYSLIVASSQGVSPIDPLGPTNWAPANLSASSFILDSDIEKAFNQARAFLNIDLFENNKVMVDAYFWCTAHFLVIDNRAAEAGLDSRGENVISSKSVGGVSVSYSVPTDVNSSGFLAQFNQTLYGQKYMNNYIRPRTIGKIGIARGATKP